MQWFLGRHLGRVSSSVGVGLSLLAMGLGSCATPPDASSDSSVQPTAVPNDNPVVLKVITTFVPITQFTKAVVGDRAQVVQLMPNTVAPHDYQATPEDVRTLASANVLVQNGLELETFLEDLVKNVENPRLKVIDTSKGITTIATEKEESHGHSEVDPSGEATHKAEQEHGHGAENPHIWLDPKRAMQQVENIRVGLIAADPAGKEVYTANAQAFTAKLRTLDQEITAALQPYRGKTFVAYHDFAPYFAQSYNLKATFLVDVPEENPAPADVKRVMNTVQASGLKTLLTEPQVGERAFAALAKDLDVKVSVFDALETRSLGPITPDDYLTVMRQNLRNLAAAFAR